MSPLQRPTQTTKPLNVGDILLAVREDGMLIDDRVTAPDDAGWRLAYGRRGVWPSTHVAGVYRTHAEAAAELEAVRDLVDRFADENGLLHPLPWHDIALRLMHDGRGMLTLHPDDEATQAFVKRRPVFFESLTKAIPTGEKLTPHALATIAHRLMRMVVEKWPDGTRCRVAVGEPTIVVDVSDGPSSP